MTLEQLKATPHKGDYESDRPLLDAADAIIRDREQTLETRLWAIAEIDRVMGVELIRLSTDDLTDYLDNIGADPEDHPFIILIGGR